MAKKNNKVKKKEESKIIHGLAGSLEEAFSEDIDELQDDDVIVIDVPETPSSGKMKKSHRVVMFIIGLLVVVFAVVGAATTVMKLSEVITDIADNTALRNEFTLYLYPVVATDPPSFEKTETLQNSTIIKTAISKILLTGDLTNYENDTGVMYIPEFDVETAAKSIFGTGITLEHETVGNVPDRATYNIEKKAYAVTNIQPLPNYIPQVTEMTNVGETFTITVDYYPLSVDIPGLDNHPEAAKTMTYIITRTGERKTITSIALKNLDRQGD